MGRRIVGFLVGLLISAAAFSVIAVVTTKTPVQQGDVRQPPTVTAETAPEAQPPAPAEAEPDEVAEPVTEPDDAPIETASPEPAPAPVEEPAEDAPIVVAETAPQPEPAPVDQPKADLSDPEEQAPLKKPEVLTDVAPAPTPVPPVPNPPLQIAEADPVPEPAPQPEIQSEPEQEVAAEPAPEPEPALEAVPEQAASPDPDPAPAPEPVPEPQPTVVAEVPVQTEPAPAVRRSRLPVVSDDTSRSAGIQFGQPSTSGLPSVTGTDTVPQPAIPAAPKFQKAPPPTAAKRLTAPKSAPPEPDKVVILTPEPEAEQAAPEKPRAIDEYGVLFDAGDKPTLSIILVDVGNAGVTLNAAATIDLPVTFAVPVDRKDATLAANRYYESGHEVLALSPRSVELSLSGGQTKEQVADLLTRFFEIIPQSVGLLDVPEATLQNDRVLSNYVLAALHESGHGLVTYEEGLNVVKREADKADVPAGLIYRSIDRKGENVAAIERHLDRAAAEAARFGHVLVIGSTRADTIDAIEAWAKSRSARSVALAPVSASIK